MAEDLEDETFPIGMLLAGPITAIQEAQIETERQVMEFVIEYGLEEFVRKTDNKNQNALRLKTFDFEMDKAIPDAENPGSTVMHKVNVSAPLLSIMRLPGLSVDEANIDLSLDVELSKQSSSKAATKPTASKPAASKLEQILATQAITKPLIKGSIASRSASRSFRSKGRMNFNLKLKSAEDDEVYGRLVRFISEGMNASITTKDK